MALEAIKDQMTLAQLAQKFEVNAVTISKWKSEFLANMSLVFSNVKDNEHAQTEVPVEKLYAQIGQLKVELDFVKKVRADWEYPRVNGNHKRKSQKNIVAQTV